MSSFPRGEHCVESEIVMSAGAIQRECAFLPICISHGLSVVGQNNKLKNVVVSC
jgi:hypothetical protein